MTYSFFELRNFFKEKAIIVLFLIFLGITIAPQFLLTPDENFDKGYLYALEGSIEMQKEILDAGDLPPHVAENIAEELKLNEMLLSKIKNNDLTEALKAELAKETFTLKGVENGSISGPTLVEQKLLVAKLEYLVKNKLLKVSDDTAVMPAVNYLMSSMRPYMPIFLVVSLILSYAYSLEKRRKTIDFLNVIPVSLKRISITKFLLFTSLTSLLVLVSFLLNYIIAMAKNGTGSWKYPIVVTPDGQTVEVMTAQTFVLKEMCLLLLIL
jgi:ABC-type transport system involved in multi-copper enzyme maturation permease subunit